MALMTGIGVSGSDHSFYAFNAVGAVWNGSAFVVWDDADYLTYRIAATEIGTTGEFTATLPTGAERWSMRFDGASLAASYLASVGAATASQASVDAVAEDVGENAAAIAAVREKTDLFNDGTEVAMTVNTGVGAGGKLYFRKADGFDETFAVAGSIASDDRIVLTVKADRKNDADAAAILKWDSAVGLVCIEGAEATAADGSVAIVDATARTIRLILAANAAASLIPRTNAAHYDVKRFPASGEPYGVAVGNASIANAVTHET